MVTIIGRSKLLWIVIGLVVIASIAVSGVLLVRDRNSGNSNSTAHTITRPTLPVPGENNAISQRTARTSSPEGTAAVTGLLPAVPARLPERVPLPSGDPELYRAIWAGTPDDVRDHIVAGQEVNVSNEDGDLFLYTAIWRAHPDTVQILVDAGADVNARDSDNHPLLYTAIWRDKPEVLKILAAAGADVNAKDAGGDPMLHEAIWRDHTEIVRILVDAGADVNAKDADGDPLLHEARWRGHTEIEQILLAAGATE